MSYETQRIVYALPKNCSPSDADKLGGFSRTLNVRHPNSWVRLESIESNGLYGIGFNRFFMTIGNALEYEVVSTTPSFSKISININLEDMIPDGERGSPRQDREFTRGLLSTRDDWLITILVTPIVIQKESIGNLELFFVNDAASYKDGIVAELRSFLTDDMFPRKHVVCYIDAVDLERNWDETCRGNRWSLPITSQQASVYREVDLFVINGDAMNTLSSSIDINCETLGVGSQDFYQKLGRMVYGKDPHILKGYHSNTFDVSDFALCQISNYNSYGNPVNTAHVHETLHALGCDGSNSKSKIHTSTIGLPVTLGTEAVKPFREGDALEEYKRVMGNPDLLCIPANGPHPLPAETAVRFPTAFAFQGGIPHPLVWDIMSYAVQSIKPLNIALAAGKYQGLNISTDQIQSYAPEIGNYFENACAVGFNVMFEDDYEDYLPDPSFIDILTKDPQTLINSIKQTKTYFLIRLHMWGFFPDMVYISAAWYLDTVKSVDELYSKFEEHYKEEYDLPYSDKNSLEQTLGDVILFKTDSRDVEKCNAPRELGDDRDPEIENGLWSHNSKKVLDYVGFRVAKKILTIHNGELMTKIESDIATALPTSKSPTEPRYENLIVSELKCEDYDAEYGNTKDDIIKSYLGGEKFRQKLEISNDDPAISPEYEEFYIIKAPAPTSTNFTPYTISDPYKEPGTLIVK